MLFKYLFAYVLLAVTFLSCEESLSGAWRFNYGNDEKNLGIDFLFLKDGSASIIDLNGIMYDFPNVEISGGRLLLMNQYQKISLDVGFEENKHLRVDSRDFMPLDLYFGKSRIMKI